MTKRKPKTEKRLKEVEQVKDTKVATGFGVREVYEPEYTLAPIQIRNLILTCGWIEDCANTITDEVVKYPLKAKPEDEAIDTFLKFPSLVDPLFIIRKKYLKDMYRYGNGACVIGYKGGKPKTLVPVPGYTLRITNANPPNYKFKNIRGSGYKQKNGVDIVLKNKEVMHFAIEANSDTTLAISPIKRIYNQVLTDKYTSEKLASFTSRGFFKPSFISIEKANKTEVEEFVELLNNLTVEGCKMFGINKVTTVSDLPVWSAEDIIAVQRWLGLRIANAYKVPPFMLNLAETTGSLNAREQRARFLENVVLPVLEYESYLYTLKVARQAFKNEKVEIVTPNMSLKLNYNRVRTAMLTIRKDESLLTENEARDYFLNLPPKE